MDVMRSVRLSMGQIDYTDTGGQGRVVCYAMDCLWIIDMG
jgi:hypothetical protein